MYVLKNKNGETIAKSNNEIEYNSKSKNWQVDNTIVSDPVKKLTVYSTLVTPNSFKLKFTTQERLAIKAKRVTDEIIDDFFSILDDSRTTAIDLDDPIVNDAIGYTIGAVASDLLYSQEDVVKRVNEIVKL